MQKPRLSFIQILNMSMGFFGIQMGFALQNANASRILQTFGASVEHLSWFWIVAPLTGMIIQPIIGHYSDHTWTRLGRRRPYFLVGALCTACALIMLPNANILAFFLPPVMIGVGMLMIMDASINVAMEPFRALVADMLPNEQSTTGFSVQTFLIGIGAVVGSWLPYILFYWLGIGKNITAGGIPMNVVISFIIGAIVLIVSILWTVFTTKEYSPQEMSAFQKSTQPIVEEESSGGLSDIFLCFSQMPKIMRQLGWVQFFSWIGFFGMWVYATPAVAEHFFHTIDPESSLYQQAGDWVGVLFGVYNAVAMIAALLLIPIAKKIGRRMTHTINLAIGAIGLISILIIDKHQLLIFPMIGVGIAWASVLAMPYAILAPSLPTKKTGTYMGIFNFFITIPQIVNALFSGLILKYVFQLESVYMLIVSGIFLLIAAIFTLRIN